MADRRLDLHRLEPALEGGVLLEVLRYSSSVVAPIVCSLPRASIGFRIDAAPMAPRPPRPDKGVDLVDEQDDVAAGADLQYLLQALLEITAVAAAGDECAEVDV